MRRYADEPPELRAYNALAIAAAFSTGVVLIGFGAAYVTVKLGRAVLGSVFR